MIYFTSDPHYYHYGIIEVCKRPIPGWKAMTREEAKEQMNKLLIQKWNDRISNKDEVYMLGDFAFVGKTKIPEIVKQLNGIKYMIRGNHDAYPDQFWLDCGFTWVKDYYKLQVHDVYETDDGKFQQYHQPIVLCHFPILSWDGLHHGTWHLHGHCHGSLPVTKSMRMDVGVDTNDLNPYSYDEIKNIMIMRSVVPVDHHGA